MRSSSSARWRRSGRSPRDRMGVQELLAWEQVLKSQVAVALLLLAGMMAISAVLLRWAWTLYRENQELNQEFRNYLKTTADLGPVLDTVARVLELNGDRQ